MNLSVSKDLLTPSACFYCVYHTLISIRTAIIAAADLLAKNGELAATPPPFHIRGDVGSDLSFAYFSLGAKEKPVDAQRWA